MIATLMHPYAFRTWHVRSIFVQAIVRKWPTVKMLLAAHICSLDRLFVILAVAGSSPVSHPDNGNAVCASRRRFCFPDPFAAQLGCGSHSCGCRQSHALNASVVAAKTKTGSRLSTFRRTAMTTTPNIAAA